MAFDFNTFQRGQAFTKVGRLMYRVIPRIECADGFTFSVQASETHYCSPRANGCHEYETVEVGFPSERVEALMPYMDDDDSDPTQTVYGGVPVSVVNAIVAEHGGPK